ncbi:hypothetical protein [Agromyces humi]|uniref:hypothetical protein n=1 Tax=Agromyces humi TaxID=1766800 RepID=UPI00135801A0|nr:hypothetical protein [Agromyces humi]
MKRRVRAIRYGLAEHGFDLDWDEPAQPSTTVRTGDAWATVGEALEQLPRYRYPAGLRGRRDAWILVLIAVLGMSRRQAASVSPEDVELDHGVRVAGRTVPRTVKPGECPACAAIRWLDVVGRAHYGWRMNLKTLLMLPDAPPVDHDCDRRPAELWRDVPALTVAVDTHGWVQTGQPLGRLSISRVMKQSQRLMGSREVEVRRRVVSERFADATLEDLADAYDDVDARLTELLKQAEAVLDDSRDLLGRIAGEDEAS